jgi:hypothetical protein
MKSTNGIYMFSGLSHAQKIAFNLNAFTAVLPINSADLQAGSIIYGEGAPVGGLYVKETVPQVNELVDGWFTTHPGQAGRA